MAVDGEATGPLVIFVNSLAKFVGEERPTRFVACWDSGGSRYREAVFPPYKLARRQAAMGSTAHAASFALIKEFLALSGIGQWGRDGVEADDLIAAAHRDTEGRKVILSSDKDLLQLLDGETELIRFTGAVKADRWDSSRVQYEYGCEPARLGQVFALSGDMVDGIPGLPGIGPKRAVKMLGAHEWDWDALMARLSAEQHRAAELYRSLVDLTYLHEPVPSVPPWSPYPRYSVEGINPVLHPPLLEFCERYKLTNIQHRIETRTLWL